MLVEAYERFVLLRRNLRLARLRFDSWVDAFWGYDVFIAHRRADAADYAKWLYEKLGAEKISCFIDRTVYGPGLSLRVATRRHVAKSTLLCLVGSPELLRPRRPIDWVEEEVDSYLRSHRNDPKVLVIDFGGLVTAALDTQDAGTSDSHKMLNQLRPFLRQTEEFGALAQEPSEGVLAAVRANITGRRRDRTRLIFFQTTAATLLLLLAAAAVLGVLAWSQKHLAQQETIRALNNEKKAQANERLANLSQEEARRDLEIAKSGADDLAFRLTKSLPTLKNRQAQAILEILESARKLIEPLALADPYNQQVQKSHFLILSQMIEPAVTRRELSKARYASDLCWTLRSQLTLSDEEVSTFEEKSADFELAVGDPSAALSTYTKLLKAKDQKVDEAYDEFDRQADEILNQDGRYRGYFRDRRLATRDAARESLRIGIKLAKAMSALGRTEDARARLKDLIAEAERVDGFEDYDLISLAYLAMGRNQIEQNDLSGALTSFQKSSTNNKDYPTRDGVSPEFISRIAAAATDGIGDIKRLAGSWLDAARSYEESYRSQKGLATIDQSNVIDAYESGVILIKLADVKLQSDRQADAFNAYVESALIFADLFDRKESIDVRPAFRISAIGLSKIEIVDPAIPVEAYEKFNTLLSDLKGRNNFSHDEQKWLSRIHPKQ